MGKHSIDEIRVAYAVVRDEDYHGPWDSADADVLVMEAIDELAALKAWLARAMPLLTELAEYLENEVAAMVGTYIFEHGIPEDGQAPERVVAYANQIDALLVEVDGGPIIPQGDPSCPGCQGTGTVQINTRHYRGPAPCPVCGGQYRVMEEASQSNGKPV